MPLAIRIHACGGPEQLHCECVDTPEPQAGEALVRTTAIGVNFIDTYHRSGLYPLPSLPHGIGVEAAGVVEALGRGVTDLDIGARVAWAGGTPGAYAELVAVPAERLVPLPASIADETAAAVLLKGMTAEYLVQRAFKVMPGMTVLVHAAAGGVGLLLCQWLRDLGATVIGTVSTDAKAARAAANGCTHPVLYTREDLVTTVRMLTDGEGVHVVYDGVGKDTLLRSLDCLRRRGTLVSFGNASGKPDPLDAFELSRRGSLYMTRPSLYDYTHTRSELMTSAMAVFDRVQRGALKVHISERVPLLEAMAAHQLLESRGSVGAIVLKP